MGLGKKTIDDQNYCGKKVLVRCDFNVPMKDGVITNENRINAALPTIQKLVNDGAKVILCSHLGKPKNGPEAKFSLAPVAVALSAKLGKTVVFADDDNVVGENAKAAVAAMSNGDVVLLQNTRFRKEETKNMPEFSEELASLADAYVDDAFGSCHRAHCSTAGVTDFIKDTGNKHGAVFVGALGAEYAIDRDWAARLEYQYTTPLGDTSLDRSGIEMDNGMLAFAMLYRFGQQGGEAWVFGHGEAPPEGIRAEAIHRQWHQLLALQAQQRGGVAGDQRAQGAEQAPVTFRFDQLTTEIVDQR